MYGSRYPVRIESTESTETDQQKRIPRVRYRLGGYKTPMQPAARHDRKHHFFTGLHSSGTIYATITALCQRRGALIRGKVYLEQIIKAHHQCSSTVRCAKLFHGSRHTQEARRITKDETFFPRRQDFITPNNWKQVKNLPFIQSRELYEEHTGTAGVHMNSAREIPCGGPPGLTPARRDSLSTINKNAGHVLLESWHKCMTHNETWTKVPAKRGTGGQTNFEDIKK